MTPDRPLRVALAADWFPPRRGGLETQLLGLARALGNRDLAVTVVTGTPGPSSLDGVQIERLDTPRLPGHGLAIAPGLASMVQARLAPGNFDLVHIHPSIVAPVCLAGVIAARRLGLPVLLTFHSVMHSLPFWLRLADRIAGWTGPDVRLAGVSATIARQLAPLSPDLAPVVLPNGFDHSFWQGPPWPQPAADGAPFRIVTAMRFERRKRPLALLRAFRAAAASAASRGVALELVAAGDGTLSGPFRRMAGAAPVRLAGWLDPDGLRALYRSAHLFVLASRRESFGLAALEARAAGLPVVARAGTGLADHLTGADDGVLAEDDAAMARAIADIACDRERWQAMAGARPALERFDWPVLAERHEALYRQMLRPGA